MKMARLFGSLYLLVQGSFTIHFIVAEIQSSDGEVYTGGAAGVGLPHQG